MFRGRPSALGSSRRSSCARRGAMTITQLTCPLDCADACGVLVESDAGGRFVGMRGNPEHGYSRGGLCGKTAIYGELVASDVQVGRTSTRTCIGELERRFKGDLLGRARSRRLCYCCGQEVP